MATEEEIEKELLDAGYDPHFVFLLGSDDDASVCGYTADGAVFGIFMADERADRLAAYLKKRGRVFRTHQEALAGFKWVSGCR